MFKISPPEEEPEKSNDALSCKVYLVEVVVVWTFHNSTMYDKCQSQQAKVLALSLEPAYHDDSNETLQPIC